MIADVFNLVTKKLSLKKIWIIILSNKYYLKYYQSNILIEYKSYKLHTDFSKWNIFSYYGIDRICELGLFNLFTYVGTNSDIIDKFSLKLVNQMMYVDVLTIGHQYILKWLFKHKWIESQLKVNSELFGIFLMRTRYNDDDTIKWICDYLIENKKENKETIFNALCKASNLTCSSWFYDKYKPDIAEYDMTVISRMIINYCDHLPMLKFIESICVTPINYTFNDFYYQFKIIPDNPKKLNIAMHIYKLYHKNFVMTPHNKILLINLVDSHCIFGRLHLVKLLYQCDLFRNIILDHLQVTCILRQKYIKSDVTGWIKKILIPDRIKRRYRRKTDRSCIM